jgi:thiol-disulfide isomerase/thioredoxin
MRLTRTKLTPRTAIIRSTLLVCMALVCFGTAWAHTPSAVQASHLTAAQVTTAQEWVQIPPYQKLTPLNHITAKASQPTLLLAFAPQCKYCKAQMRVMQQLHQQCPDAAMALIGVQAATSELRHEIRRLQPQLPAFVADTAFLRAIDGIAAVPTSLLLDSQNRLVLKHRGMLQQEDLQRIVQEWLAPSCQVRTN